MDQLTKSQQIKLITALYHGGFINPFKVAKEGLQRGIDFIFSGARNQASGPVRRFLEQHGNSKIKNITIFREPINKVVEKVTNVISLGYWQDIKDKLNYDNLFHLWMEVDLSDGTSWAMEKNEVIQFKPTKNRGERGLVILLKGPLTVNEFFAGGKRVLKDKFWSYRARDNNCQVWISSMLLGSNLFSEASKEFILQDTETLLASLPTFTEGLINGVTDIAARVDILRNGSGIKYKRRY